jgi:hypothetical protein
MKENISAPPLNVRSETLLRTAILTNLKWVSSLYIRPIRTVHWLKSLIRDRVAFRIKKKQKLMVLPCDLASLINQTKQPLVKNLID